MTQRAFVVVGLGFGDEGKGSVVDWLVREHGASLVARFNGGAQAAHRVVTDDGREHVFSMFGSGTLAGADTYLSEHVLVNPEVIAIEAMELIALGVKNPLAQLYVNPIAPITTIWHVVLNRLREMSRGKDRHGSCGQGIAETMVDVLAPQRELCWLDLRHPKLPDRLRKIADAKRQLALVIPEPVNPSEEWWRCQRCLHDMDATLEDTVDTYRTIAAAVAMDFDFDAECIVFEGAQGVLLDEHWGYDPYTTWSTTTSLNAHSLLDGRDYETTTLGVLRGYMTRHGRGPFPTEVGLDGLPIQLDARNAFNPWQEDLRYGWPDSMMAWYAAQADGHLDGLIVTCLDQIKDTHLPIAGIRLNSDLWNPVTSPNYQLISVDKLPDRLAQIMRIPLYAVSTGPTASGKQLT